MTQLRLVDILLFHLWKFYLTLSYSRLINEWLQRQVSKREEAVKNVSRELLKANDVIKKLQEQNRKLNQKVIVNFIQMHKGQILRTV